MPLVCELRQQGGVTLSISVFPGNCLGHTGSVSTLFKTELGDFLGGPVVKTLSFKAGDSGTNPVQGTKMLYASDMAKNKSFF